MRPLSLPLAVSLAAHGLLLAVVLFWAYSDGTEAPLAGGGGGHGVTVEIIGGEGPHAVSAPQVPEPRESADPEALKLPARKEALRRSKPGSPRGDDVPAGSSGPAGPGQGPEPAGPGSGAGGGSSILAEIRARIERAKRYPLMARRMNIEGVSRVRFAIDASGQPQGLALKSSSGSPVLDEEALSTIRRAAPFPAYDEDLEIGIRFEIDK
ncbi:MAG TPA: energy transducer TonB [bacterium]|nr:energy transducer TonB [bacterium]